MPRVKIILKNQDPVTIEGANQVNWISRNQTYVYTPGEAALLEVSFKDAKSSENPKVVARFDPAAAVGYVIDES